MLHRLVSGPASLEVDLDDGGRWTSLVVDGLELLSGADVEGVPVGVRHGCFVMAPYAGRLGHGLLTWRGTTHRLPVDAPPHAIHGHVFDAPWLLVDGAPTARLTDPWPYAGTVAQELELRDDGLGVRVVLAAEQDMPAVLGLHPWFARRLARGGELELDVTPLEQCATGPDALPTGELVAPRPGPWDDCFVGMAAPPRLVWPGALALTLRSSAEHWVVFDQLPDVVCVEPQTGPPDAVALGEAAVVPAGGRLELSVELTWE